MISASALSAHEISGAEAAAAAVSVISAGGLHSIWEGIGDPGVGVVCQTLHTIEQGIAA